LFKAILPESKEFLKTFLLIKIKEEGLSLLHANFGKEIPTTFATAARLI